MAEQFLAEALEAVAQMERDRLDPIELDDGRQVFRAANGGLVLLDPEATAPRPRRTRGTIEVQTASGLRAYAARHRDTSTAAYVDAAGRATVVVNDDNRGTPGWRDHRVDFAPVDSMPASLWKAATSVAQTQASFATLLDSRLDEIVEPSGVEIVRLITTLQVNIDTKVANAVDPANGRRGFVFEEDIKTTVVLPRQIEAEFPLWVGTDPVAVNLELRWFVRDGQIKFQLDWPNEAELKRVQLRALVDGALEGLDIPIIEGVAPTERTASDWTWS